ncbi:uncharacterized protein [Ambystoma mexicanum]|uniref:uncharacterized protein n=1 Tax=Ambystoma mexicanum TaxID=8296 RepID=UPI0037E877D4
MDNRQVPSPSSPKHERDPQYKPEVLIIPLHPMAETPASPAREDGDSPPKQSPSKTELLAQPLSPTSPTSPTSVANRHSVSSIKQLQLMFEKEHISQAASTTVGRKTPPSTLERGHSNLLKQLQSVFEKEETSKPSSVRSSNQTTTSPFDAEKARSPKDEPSHYPLRETIILSNTAITSAAIGEITDTPKGGSNPSDKSLGPPLNGQHSNSGKREDMFNSELTPITLGAQTPTALVNGEHTGSPKELRSPGESPVSTNQLLSPLSPLSPLAKPELILELKKGKCLRHTHQSKGLTTVFSGNAKQNRRVSFERSESTASCPESDGSMPTSPSQNGHA